MKKTALLALALSISLCNLLADTSVIHGGSIDDLENKAAMAEVVWNIEDISKVSVYFSTNDDAWPSSTDFEDEFELTGGSDQKHADFYILLKKFGNVEPDLYVRATSPMRTEDGRGRIHWNIYGSKSMDPSTRYSGYDENPQYSYGDKTLSFEKKNDYYISNIWVATENLASADLVFGEHTYSSYVEVKVENK